MQKITFSFLLALSSLMLFLSSCKEEVAPPVTPNMSITDATAFEGNFTMKFQFRVTLSVATTQAVTVNYATKAGSALAMQDFTPVTGTLTFAAGETQKIIEVPIVCDTLKEADESFSVELSGESNAIVTKAAGTGTIRNDDTFMIVAPDGYITPESYPGMTMLWRDEFSGSQIDPNIWDYNIGGSGWGNNELQYYTNSSENSYINDGHLVIEAKQQNVGGRNYTSARLLSKGKKEFKFGRVDIRAILPKGQGIWPALWMLGANIDQVGWSKCGEIDIMEMRGQDPTTVLGTVHYDNSANNHEYKGGSTFLTGGKKFSDEFHVFSLIWNEDVMQFLVDDKQYYQATRASLGTTNYPFNAPFFMIMNVAVGGNFLGNPDASTVFPQKMIVDYVRVFQ